MNKTDLQTNKTDVITSVASAAISFVPVIGGALSEIIHITIPKQREDRIVKFLKEVDDRLNELNITVNKLNSIFENNQYGVFTYDCLKSVANERYEDKLKYYKRLYINGLTSEEDEMLNNYNVMMIISDMNFKEILFLKDFYYSFIGFHQKEKQEILKQLGILTLMPIYTNKMTQEESDKETYKQMIINSLEKKGLLNKKITQEKLFDRHEPYKETYEISQLGILILRKIGEIDNE